jgi:hypothetical protein
LLEKGLNIKDSHKEMFRVYGGKCLSRKAFHNWAQKRDKYFADDEEVEMGVLGVAETRANRFLFYSVSALR